MEAAALLVVLLVLGLLGSGVVALGVAIAARRRAVDAEERLADANVSIDRLDRQLLELKREVRSLRERVGGEEEKEAAPAPAPPPRPAGEPPAIPREAREAPARAPIPPVIVPPPAARPAAPPEVPAAAQVSVPPEIPAEPPPAPPSFRPPPPASPPPAPRPRFDWESFVGVKLFSWIAAVAFAISAVFLLRIAIERGLFKPIYRASLSGIVGMALVLFSEMKFARRYSVTANALEGAGLFILFATGFASHSLWHLIGPLFAFVFMAVVAGAAVALSIGRDSVFIALLGLVGGFSTPALLSTGQDRPYALFGYLLLLNAGLAWVAYRKRWPLLVLLALAGTTFYQWAWVVKFLAPGKLPIAVGIFLVFPLLSVLFDTRRQSEEESHPAALFRASVAAGAAFPVLFAVHFAAVPAYGERFLLLFAFLAVLVIGLSAVAIARKVPVLHMAAGLSTPVVFATWLALSYTHEAWPAILAIAAGFVVLHLAVALAAERLDPELEESFARALALVPAVLLFVFPFLAGLEPRTAEPLPFFGVLFVLMALLAGLALHRKDGLVHFTGAFFVLAAEAVWSSRHLTKERLLAALLVYGSFALFYLGVPLLARRLNRTLRPEGSGSIALFLSVGLLFFLASGPMAESALWGMALLLALINLGLLVEARSPGGTRAALWGMALSWGVLVVWWRNAPLTALLVPALVVTAAFAVVVLGGSLGAEKRSGEAGVGQGAWLSLAGHVFLLFVVTQRHLVIPPWPVLGVLGVLLLALGAGALFTGRGALHVAGVAATQVVLLVWVGAVGEAPWPTVAVASAGIAAAVGILFLLLARWRALDDRAFPDAAVAGVFLAEAVAVLATGATGAPGAGFLAVFHLLLVCAFLWLAWSTGRLAVAVIAVPATAAALFTYRGARFPVEESWQGELLLAAAVTAPFLVFPLLLDRKVGARIEPHLTAVLATVPFFFIARHALVAGGYEPVIGLLPVGLAAALLVLVKQLLRLETTASARGGFPPVVPPGGIALRQSSRDRQEGRLALVAGAALAFITVAVPLQLEKEWITIGWALQAAALAWLYQRIPHRGLLFSSLALFVTVFVRLVLNPAVLSYHPRGGVAILNWYLYTYLVAALAFLVGAWLLSTTADDLPSPLPRVSTLLRPGAAVLLFLLVNIEIADYFSKGPHITFNFRSASFTQDLWYTLGWALYAIALLAIGIWKRSRATRVTAIALLVVTIFKCFVHDLARLEGLQRVVSFAGLAVCLVLVALALQRFVLRPAREER